MKYEKTIKLVELNKQLIGKKVIGATIDELVIYPTNQKSYDLFIKTYLRTLNGEEAIIPFKNEDVDIHCVVDKGRIAANGLFAHASLLKVKEEHEVTLE